MGFLSQLFGGRKPRVAPVSLNEENFRQEVLQHHGPCLVDVWSYGCPHCSKLAPTIGALATKYKGRIKVCELNVGNSPRLAQSLGVRGTPTVVVFENGRLLGRIVGFRPQNYYEEMIESEFPVSDWASMEKDKRDYP